MTYPTVIRNSCTAFDRQRSEVSIDFEFPRGNMAEPSIVGLSSGAAPVSGYYNDDWRGLLRELEEIEVTWIGHNALTTEREIIGAETGSIPPLDRMEDTLLMHYLCNAELCKGVTKSSADDDEEENVKEIGLGYMDLWTMSSLYTELPQWKQCRGLHCSGPCRVHDVLGYNGIDALSCDVALPRLREDMERKKIPQTLYDNLKKLAVFCFKMSEKGVKVDRDLVALLEKSCEDTKQKIFPSKWVNKIGKKGQVLKTQELVWDAPFNPRSPKQVVEWFRSNSVNLDSTDKDDIQRAIDHMGDAAPEDVKTWIVKLLEFKVAGKGLKAWTDERFFGAYDLMHPRFIPTGTSLGRLSSAWPNFQNIPRVGWGKGVRAAIIPRDPSLIFGKADKSQLELRVCLWYAGYDVSQIPSDAFTWLVEQGKGTFEKCAEIVGGGKSARDLAKSVSHGADYGEGIKVFYGKDLQSARTKKALETGALVVYKDWSYHGGVVGFTGVNLAERLFGSASWENRKKALEIQEAYFSKFRAIREWQQRVSKQVEEGFVRSASGRYLTLLGSAEDKLKIAFAFFGQGSGADDVQEGMIRYGEMGSIPVLQCHDELVFEFDRATTDDQIKDHFRVMSAPSNYMPGFSCPVKVSKGENWLDMTEVGKV